MAEIVGIIASAVAMGQFLERLPRIVSGIKMVAQMDDELAHLLNEVNSLQGVIEFIDEVLQSEAAQTPSAQNPDSSKVCNFLDAAAADLRRIVGMLEELAQDCHKQREDQLLPKARRRKWIWNRDKLQRLRKEVKGAKGKLQLAFSARAFLNQRFQNGVLFEIREIVTHHSAQMGEIGHALTSANDGFHDSETVVEGTSPDTSPDTANPHPPEEPPPKYPDQGNISTSTQVIRQSTASGTQLTYVSIKGTYRRHCLASCLCNCHVRRTSRRSPAWMTKVLGSFFLSYDCLPIVDPRHCDSDSCLNYNNLMRLAWHLPAWAWSRALVLAVQTTEMFGVGMRIWFEIPKIIPYSHPIWTPWGKQTDEWMVELLMTDKINPNDCDSTGQTVLYWAVTMPERLRFLDLILDYYGIDSRDKITQKQVGFNARHLLLENGASLDPPSLRSLNRLIALTEDSTMLGANPSPIHASIQSNASLEVLSDAIDANRAAINAWDRLGETPLTLACTLGHTLAVTLLIGAGADPNALSSRHLSPLNSACFRGSVSCVERLLVARCDVDARHAFRPPIHELVWSTHSVPAENIKTILKLLHAYGANLSATSLFEDWPLQLAIYKRRAQVFRALVRLGADLAKAKGFNGWSLLHYLAAFGTVEFLRILLEDVDLGKVGLEYGVRARNNMTPVDVFKCAMSGPGGALTHPEWRWPTDEEIELFDELMGRLRAARANELITVLRGAADGLDGSARAEDIVAGLRAFARGLWGRGKAEEGERLRKLILDVKEAAKAWKDLEKDEQACQRARVARRLDEWAEELERSLRTSPLKTWSWVDDQRMEEVEELDASDQRSSGQYSPGSGDGGVVLDAEDT